MFFLLKKLKSEGELDTEEEMRSEDSKTSDRSQVRSIDILFNVYLSCPELIPVIILKCLFFLSLFISNQSEHIELCVKDSLISCDDSESDRSPNAFCIQLFTMEKRFEMR